MNDRKRGKRRHENDSSISSSDDEEYRKSARKTSESQQVAKERKKKSRQEKRTKRESSSTSDSGDDRSHRRDHAGKKKKRKNTHEKDKARRKKEKRKKREKEKKSKRRRAREEEKAAVKGSEKDFAVNSDRTQAVEISQEQVLANPESVPKKRSMVPMTKEEYEKQQAQVRRVYDPDTGRHRLVKGTGEILEEIVSKDRHKAINKTATQGDGAFFQASLGLKDKQS